jgi:hypothetical protein
MKTYLKNATLLIIHRNVANSTTATGVPFEATYGEAIRDGDLNTNGGTMDIHCELHPSEYVNFEGCRAGIIFDGERPYLDRDGARERSSGAYYENGEAVWHDEPS